jgi:signal transduction histidine kinase
MPLTTSQQLIAFSNHLAARRESILFAWRKAARADPEQTTGRALTLGQFLDHIPQILDGFELQLRSRPGGAAAQAADSEKKVEEVKHGLHRWQQGYRLKELLNECGLLQLCLVEELGRIAAKHPELEHETLLEANRQLLHLINDTISESAAQYERMQRAEASGRLNDLMGVLAHVHEIEQRRATLIHQAVHDLTSDALGVSMAATWIGKPDTVETQRVETAAFLQRAVQGLIATLGELMVLTRLEAGQEKRKISTFDAAALITELGQINQSLAHERGLFLKANGPASLTIDGDADKVGRLLKNLLINALKYTGHGGVTVSWGAEEKNWWMMVKDTGPGLLAGPGAPMLVGLQEATVSAKESDVVAAAVEGEASHVLTQPQASSTPARPCHQQAGEGIGLSIVKRLCELLDASLEIASSAETGTTFRVVFPSCYPTPVDEKPVTGAAVSLS